MPKGFFNSITDRAACHALAGLLRQGDDFAPREAMKSNAPIKKKWRGLITKWLYANGYIERHFRRGRWHYNVSETGREFLRLHAHKYNIQW